MVNHSAMKLMNPNLRMSTFQEMALSAPLMDALQAMSIKRPTAIQSQAIPVGLTGTDLIAVAQTGSGKTQAFALTVLMNLEKKPESRALVLAPSREMAQQIHKVFVSLCAELEVDACLIVGGLPGAKQTSQLKKKPRLIIATPGRLYDHLIKNKLLLQNVEFVVIDEADRMLDMGFAPQLKNIQNTMRGTRQTLMFSASFGTAVESIAQMFMREHVIMIRDENAEAPVSSLKQKVLLLDRSMKFDRLLDELNATKGSVIVFTGSQDSCEQVGKFLKEYGYKTDYTHGAQSQGHRNRVIREFREGQIRVMVATDMLARGIDVPHVECVMNFDLPFQMEDFLHRIGRTARAGRGGQAITFITPSDQKMYQKVRNYLEGAQEIFVDPQFKFIERNKKFQMNRPSGHAGKARKDHALAGDPRRSIHNKGKTVGNKASSKNQMSSGSPFGKSSNKRQSDRKGQSRY